MKKEANTGSMRLDMLAKYLNYLKTNMNLKDKTLDNKKYMLMALYALHGGEVLWIADYNTVHGLILRTAERGMRKPWDRNTNY